MMTTYKISNNFEDYWSFSISNTELFSKIPDYDPRFKAKPQLEKWVEPNSEFYASDNYSGTGKPHIPDITTWLGGCLVLNAKAYKALHNILSPYGEFLPTKCAGIQYQIFNTLHVIPDSAIDQAVSKQDVQDAIYMGVERLAFHEDLIDKPVFKTTFDKTLYTYCQQTFRDAVESNNLQGCVFTEQV